MAWNAAENHCISLGGHLASIHSQDEHSEVVSLTLGAGDYHWIGFSDSEIEVPMCCLTQDFLTFQCIALFRLYVWDEVVE
jgi:hypothetical protein